MSQDSISTSRPLGSGASFGCRKQPQRLALRLKEALPELVTVHESRSFFRGAKTTGVTVELGDSRYHLDAGTTNRFKCNSRSIYASFNGKREFTVDSERWSNELYS